jgi:hypothetical protein
MNNGVGNSNRKGGLFRPPSIAGEGFEPPTFGFKTQRLEVFNLNVRLCSETATARQRAEPG